MIKAIFLDVDGTILSFSTHQIPVSAQNALTTLYNKGYKIIIATGRSFGDLAEISSVPYHGVVGLNGAECTLRSGEVVSRRSIPFELFQKSLELSKQYDFAVAVEGDNGIYVDKLTSRVVEMSQMVDHPLPQVINLNEVYKEGISSQLCFFFDKETEQKVMPQLPGLSATRWCDVFADINVAGVNKANG
ncbi:MAG: HAD hydrolase family protein, partial [Parabacteroides sp.]|nr:HAD hydrolase family protein [Parabacteroides sp.]